MNLSYREINYQSKDDCAIIANWHNNPEIQEFFIPKREDSEELKIYSPEDIYQEKSTCDNKVGTFQFILLDNVVIGMFSVLFDPKHKMAKDLIIGWPSILIADSALRRNGIGTEVGTEISRIAKDFGATHIEAGVFEYNKPIISLLEKYGFEYLDRREKTTYHNGRHWDGVHYLKEIE